ncbi:MAG: hypothetical protein GWN61_04185, partial [candidate division Zixibacteria bacterium]|nr:hypothetical protein [Gammaproteobacteria bacterium]NIR63272.1 hypothetical protein [candidate division Zixibacteria bacterium]NIS45253.1 hypothetical protein [candidate division Zixibacteria bacterium]NIV05399.1 hypothetical protein [candidate division Zixibacteria bacterium]NIW41864.1 hypothetical protein [candidate division Zixibacteria bacterium]
SLAQLKGVYNVQLYDTDGNVIVYTSEEHIVTEREKEHVLIAGEVIQSGIPLNLEQPGGMLERFVPLRLDEHGEIIGIMELMMRKSPDVDMRMLNTHAR